MPNRNIRESIVTSKTLEKCSSDAERLFFRLTVIADDAGRFNADPRVVLARCFPLFAGKWKSSRVVPWIDELARHEAIVLYTNATNDQFGYFPNWKKYQRVYGHDPKFPDPKDCTRVMPHSAAESRTVREVPALNLNEKEKGNEKGNEKEKENGAGTFERFWEAYPRKVGKGQAERAFLKLNPDPQLLDRMLQAIGRQKQTPQWLKDGGEFIPHPSTWLNGKRWEDELVAQVGQAPARSLVELASRGPRHDP
jgi:hypothetical protein